MPILSVAEFAKLTGKKPKDIHAYVCQNKLVKSKEGRIDTGILQNKSFLTKWTLKKDQSDIEELETGMSSVKSEKKESASDGDGFYFLDKLKGDLLEVNIEKGKLDLERKQGEVFPIEMVQTLILQQAKSLVESFKQALDDIVDLFIIKYKLSNSEAMDIRRNIAERINKGQLNAIANSKHHMELISWEYGNKRGKGERIG